MKTILMGTLAALKAAFWGAPQQNQVSWLGQVLGVLVAVLLGVKAWLYIHDQRTVARTEATHAQEALKHVTQSTAARDGARRAAVAHSGVLDPHADSNFR